MQTLKKINFGFSFNFAFCERPKDEMSVTPIFDYGEDKIYETNKRREQIQEH